MNKKLLLAGACVIGSIATIGVILSTNSNKDTNNVVSEESSNNKVTLNFEFNDSQDMRKFYSLEGQEFIKKMLPDSISSDFALFNVGKSLDKELKDVKFTTINNKEIALKDLKGKKIFIDFALASCSTCMDELDFIGSHNFKDDDIEYIHVFPRDTTANIKSLYKNSGVKLKEDHIVSETGLNGFELDDLKITNVPAKIFIDENGIVQYAFVGGINDKETLQLNLERAFDESIPKMLDFLKTNDEYKSDLEKKDSENEHSNDESSQLNTENEED